ncbi:hypothetical protein UCDDA912_g06743 [Diaporthe ampelina]|uniref:Autophagy-related protein 101 n=1 Tax=Diaporthe ampelina TaxID=1214573 RepID=A0A0G2FFT4_9PEZI|nr:hypothetical protein UCDDA912_g06743 [Diaporthe ampelina]
MEKVAEPKIPQEFILDAFADPTSVRDVVRGILHTIFFHRYFPTITPQTHEVLDLTLPYVAEPELETLIAQRTATLLRELDADRTQQRSSSPSLQQQARAVVGGFLGSPSSVPWGGGGGGGGGGANGANGGGRGQVSVQFMEKTRRRKMWYKGDEEVCWESWTIRVTVAEPRTENERAKVRKAMETTLLTTVMKIITSVNSFKDHIPPITTTETNPFPYNITVNQKDAVGGAAAAATTGGGWGGRFGGLY